MSERTLRRAQPADERVHRARRRGPSRPVLAGALVLDAVADEVDELAERRDRVAVDRPHAVVAETLAVALEPGGDVVDHHRVLLALVLGVGEQEGEELLLDELGDGPVVGVGAEGAGGDVGRHVRIVLAGRAVDGDRVERVGLESHAPVALTVLVGEADVGVVEEQQVLALHVEDQRLGVDRLGAEHARVEEGVEEERGVGGLGRHARDAADVDVRAAGAVEELSISTATTRGC